jgi:hypothetical protein
LHHVEVTLERIPPLGESVTRPRKEKAEIVTAQLRGRNVEVTPVNEYRGPQSHAEAHMAEFIAYFALSVTIVIAVAAIAYLFLQLQTVGEKDKEL